MTTSDNISAIEAIEKAMGGVTRGDWHLAGKLTIRHTSVVGGPDGWIGKVNWRNGEANAAYIAACNPVAISAILAEARKAEAMKLALKLLVDAGGEVLEGLDARIQAAPRNAVPVFHGIFDLSDALHVARTLLNGGSDAQG